jgi:oxalate decarboxylase/phosphoglucose isomerase-like protein (cupin superfamily)
MRWSRFVVLCTCAAFVFTGYNTVHAQKKAKKEAVVWPADKIQWEDMQAVPGVKVAKLWGDMNKGPYGCLVKFTAGNNHPLHYHTSDVKLIVLSGTWLYTPEGGTETKMGPGSYLLIPGGVKHSSGSSSDGECTIFQEGSAKFDLLPVEKK